MPRAPAHPRTIVLLVLGCVVSLLAVPGATPAPSPSLRLLVFTKTAAYRHDSIPAALRTIRELGAANDFAVDATEDAGVFSDTGLDRYDAVVFLLTTGDVLNGAQQAALERFVRAGGGFAGVHSAADTEYDWPWYGGLVATYFRNHPQIQPAAIDVTDAGHASTARLPRHWERTDEWYNFAANPRGRVRVLATLDESTYSPGDGAMGRDHPIAWAHEYDGGRAWYTGGGHTAESYAEPLFRAHLLGGLLYAAGAGPPRVVSLRSSVRSRRLAVTVRYAECRACAARLRLQVRGRWSATAMRTSAGTAGATTRPLPPGRWRFTIVLEDRATALTATVGRLVRVR
jgi:type 1 glutamine amidotransferase